MPAIAVEHISRVLFVMCICGTSCMYDMITYQLDSSKKTTLGKDMIT